MDTTIYGYYNIWILFIIWILYYMDTIFYGYYIIYGYYTRTVSVMGVGGAHYQTMSTNTTPHTDSLSIYTKARSLQEKIFDIEIDTAS